MSCAPISQWLLAPAVTRFAWMTATVSATTSKGSKERLNGSPAAQATMTTTGSAKVAIWMDEPTATPSAAREWGGGCAAFGWAARRAGRRRGARARPLPTCTRAKQAVPQACGRRSPQKTPQNPLTQVHLVLDRNNDCDHMLTRVAGNGKDDLAARAGERGVAVSVGIAPIARWNGALCERCAAAAPPPPQLRTMPTNAWLSPVSFEKSSIAPVRNLGAFGRVCLGVCLGEEDRARAQGPSAARGHAQAVAGRARVAPRSL